MMNAQVKPKVWPCARRLALMVGCAIAIGASATARAQTYPTKPITLVIGYAGVSDVFARVVGQRLQEQLGQPVIVDQRLGASVIAASVLAKAKPDGYTIGFVISNHATNPYLQKNLPYDTLNAFAPTSMLGQVADYHHGQHAPIPAPAWTSSSHRRGKHQAASHMDLQGRAA
jgi:tripartite-type tricarboxylate transporter receptor subunit TctC